VEGWPEATHLKQIDNFSFMLIFRFMETSPPSSSRRFPQFPAGLARNELDVALRSDEGCVRTNNEDTPLAAWLPLPVSDEGNRSPPLLLGVCDGMGGAAAGEVASREAADAILRALQREPVSDVIAMGAAVDAAIRDAAHHVFALASRTPSLHGMGTTATVCVVMNGEAVLGQVGDSRAYLFREGRLTQLTRDQTLRQLMIEKGQIDPENASDVFGAHIILQAVGTSPEVDVDLKRVPIESGDALLICSDGLVDALSDAAIAETLARANSSDEACRELVRRARDAGASDNVTCVVARPTLEPPPPRRPAEESPQDEEPPPPTARSPGKRGWRDWLSWQRRR
jgi:PPM family protein phosphatase